MTAADGGEKRWIKFASLITLIFQNASQVLLIRYARMRARPDMFLSTCAVFWTEIVKLISCILITIGQEKSLVKCFVMMYEHIVRNPFDTLKVCVPSIIYTIQNNLLYEAVSNLDAATFMVIYQLKILTTALCSVWMLRRPLSWSQWISLVILFVGVSIVQLDEQGAKKSSPVASSAAASATDEIPAFVRPQQSPAYGFLCVVIACCLSGFAGVYFEKILKGSNHISIWMRNIQLAVLAIPISLCTVYAKDTKVVNTHGLLYGFDSVVWIVVLVYAVGGLTVAVVVKYADNILKGFATSLAIVVSCLASMYLFDFFPSLKFVGGTLLVMLSVFIYSKYPYVVTLQQHHPLRNNEATKVERGLVVSMDDTMDKVPLMQGDEQEDVLATNSRP